MIKKEEVEVIETVTSEIKCDICKKALLKKKKNNEKVSYAVLILNTDYKENVISGDTDNALIQERSDLCSACYSKVLDFIKSCGGKVPSLFRDDEAVAEAFDIEF